MGANRDLGLPVRTMRDISIAFDVDGTLIDENGEENVNIVRLLYILHGFKNVKIIVWSGGGKKYAEYQGHRLGLDKVIHRYASKTEYPMIAPDIVIDDIQDTNLGTFNLIVREKMIQ